MHYDTIILELLTRIKKLEDEMEELKQVVASIEEVNDDVAKGIKGGRRNMKMTDEMIDLCYGGGKRVAAGGNVQEIADEIVASIGMNRASAVFYLSTVESMLNGKVYKRAISAKAYKKIFDSILKEYGKQGLAKAIQSARLHIDYRDTCGLNSDSVNEICDLYEGKL